MNSDWIDEGKIESPSDHDEAFRIMTEMRESIRRLRDRARLQNEKLRISELLTSDEQDGTQSPGDAQDKPSHSGGRE